MSSGHLTIITLLLSIASTVWQAGSHNLYDLIWLQSVPFNDFLLVLFNKKGLRKQLSEEKYHIKGNFFSVTKKTDYIDKF